MYTRRLFVTSAAAVSFAATAAHAQQAQQVADACANMSLAAQKSLTPQQAIDLLKAGNKRFVEGKPLNCNVTSQVKDSADGQAPKAVIIGCIDSRGSPELLFDAKMGDLF